jgi:glycosyltransferase involved in cell wall biosynthesis
MRRAVSHARRALAVIQLCRFMLWLAWARVLGYQIVWTVHDVRARRWAGIDRAGRALLARASSALLAHNDAVADRLRAELGRPVRIDVVPHGTFEGVYTASRPTGEVRAELGIPPEAFVFLSFGQMRADKQVGALLDAFASVALPEVCLVIAGVLPHRPSRRHLERAAREDGRIRVIPGDIPHDRVGELFEMADAFVLARSEIWTSGSLVLALSLGLPAVAARLAPVVDLLGEGEAGWLFEPDDVDSLAKALSRAASDPASAAEKRTAARSRGAQLPSWDAVAQQTVRLFTRDADLDRSQASASA